MEVNATLRLETLLDCLFAMSINVGLFFRVQYQYRIELIFFVRYP